MTRRPISFTIDPSLLARIDRLAELRGETRTAVIERAIRNDLAEQEDMVASMANPIVRAVYDQLLRSPKALKAIAAVVGESFSEEQLQGMQRAAVSLTAAGERAANGWFRWKASGADGIAGRLPGRGYVHGRFTNHGDQA